MQDLHVDYDEEEDDVPNETPLEVLQLSPAFDPSGQIWPALYLPTGLAQITYLRTATTYLLGRV